MAAKFELKKSSNGQFHFNLKAGNGEIIATSEMYNSKDAAKNGIESVKNNAADAEVVDLT
ncbi:MAG: YegP family protein [Rhodoglobus sp.]